MKEQKNKGSKLGIVVHATPEISEGDDDNMKTDGHGHHAGGYVRLPHVLQALHSIFSDVLVRVVEVQEL